MSISSVIMQSNINRLVIPIPGKMFRSSISRSNKALCFVLNKGYFESEDLNVILSVKGDIETNPMVVPVGNIDKVKVGEVAVYRQRVFFKSLRSVCNLCKLHGFSFYFPDNFHFGINAILNVMDELPFMERYAKHWNLPIEDWLTSNFKIMFHYMALSMQIPSPFTDYVEQTLKGKTGYLDRSPFLVASYNIDKRTSSLFLTLNAEDTRLFTPSKETNPIAPLGYTTEVVRYDIKKGRFKGEYKIG